MSKRKVKLNSLSIDVEQFAIVVNYTTENPQYDASGALVGQESVPKQKVVHVPHGLTHHEIPGLAQEVVEKCKYIPASKIGEVQQCLLSLAQLDAAQASRQQQPQKPVYGQGPDAAFEQMRQQQKMQLQQQQQQQQLQAQQQLQMQQAQALQQQQQLHQQQQQAMARQQRPPPPQQQQPQQMDQRPPKRQQPLLPEADIRQLEDYQDALYDDVMERKVVGAKRILRLCTEPSSLPLLAEHDTLLGVLSRELKENSKRSSDLSVAVASCFLCLSHFPQFHLAMQQHQCGNVVMRVFEYESERYQIRKHDMAQRTMRFQELGDTATPDDRKLLLKDEKKYKIQLSRQDKLMLVALMALLNLAEDIAIERKMVNRKMPQLLIQLLDRQNDELVLVALQFIKKLSVFEANKDDMSTPETLARLVQLGSHENVRVALLALRVLYNFSFDENLRSSLIESGIVKLLVDLLRNPPFRHIVLRLLYHFSMDDRCKSLMAYHLDGMVMLLQLVVHFPEPRVGKDLVALVVNLSTHPRCAEVMVRQSNLFPQVVLRVLKTRDPLLCKVVRHCSSHPGVLEPMLELLQSESVRMSKWMHEYVRIAPSCVDNPDLLAELLGTLVNVTLPDIQWGELCEAGLVDLLTRLLVPGFSEDDVVLECVMLVGNLALCRESANYVAGSRLPSLLQQILVEKRDDEELVVQLLYTFRCLMIYDEVREAVLSETDLAPCVMNFARSASPAVLDQATRTLQLVADHAGEAGSEWVEQIKAFRFEQHNAEWSRFIARDGAGMSPGTSPHKYYYNESHSAGDDEDDFAFRFGGGVADAADLGDREWANQDVESFARTSRQMSIS